MSVTYDQLIGDPNTYIQYTASAGSTSFYPDSNTILIGGSLYVPRVYASNLTYFEIASSGKIALSLNDIHSLDFSRSNYIDSIDYINTIQSQSNYSLKLQANSSALQFIMDAYSNNININAASNIFINANSGNMNLTTSNNSILNSLNSININAINSNITVYASNIITITSSNNFILNTNSNITINALSGSINALADKSNMYINMNSISDTISIYSLSNINFNSSNNIFLNASSNFNITTSNLNILANENINIIASNNININGSNINIVSSNNQQFSAQSNIEFFITSASNNPSDPVFAVTGDQVLIRGDLVISGEIMTSNVFNTTVIQETLKVADKTIILANVGSNFTPEDGPFDGNVNSGSGIQIDGIPLYADSNILGAYEKSIRWNNGSSTGINTLGTVAGLSNEPFWQVLGGSFQLTQQNIISSGGSNIVQNVSFKFRIGASNDLQIVKTYWTGSNYTTAIIARFGIIL